MRKVLMQNLAYDDRNGLYYVTLHAGTRPDGTRRRSVRTYRRREDAERALAAFRTDGADGGMTLGAWLALWLRDYAAPRCALTTLHGYESIVRAHLVPALGALRLSALTTAALQDYYASRLALGLSPNTVRKHHVLLHSALEAAVRRGLLTGDPARLAVPPTKHPAPCRFYDGAQLAALFRACAATRVEPAIKLAGYLGLRRSEICGLKWQHVDLERREIAVCEVRTAAGGRAVEKAPKSRASARRLGYGGVGDLDALLRRLHAESGGRGYVLTGPDGSPYHPDRLCRDVAALIAANGLPPITLHGLRHSFASVANSCSVPLLTISRALGHSSTAVTSAVYTHLFDETVRDVVTSVAAAVERAQSSVSTS